MAERDELREGLEERLGERLSALLLARITSMERRDLVTTQDLADLQSALMSRFDLIDQRFEQVDQRFEQVDQRFEQVDRRLDQVDHRLDQLDRRVDQVDHRLEAMDLRFEGAERRLSAGEHSLQDVTEQLRSLDGRFALHAAVMEQRLETVNLSVEKASSDVIATMRGELTAAVTSQTRLVIFAVLGSIASYGGISVALAS